MLFGMHRKLPAARSSHCTQLWEMWSTVDLGPFGLAHLDGAYERLGPCAPWGFVGGRASYRFARIGQGLARINASSAVAKVSS